MKVMIDSAKIVNRVKLSMERTGLSWHIKFSKYKSRKDKNRVLRLVLGSSRSGTSWVAAVLAHTTTPVRYFYEPLFFFSPKLFFNEGLDHTGIRYVENLSKWHPLVMVYRLFNADLNDWKRLLNPYSPYIPKHKKPDFTLVKEVHSLLATEALLKKLNCKAILAVRDPIVVADSIFCRDKFGGICLIFEKGAVFRDSFVTKYAAESRDEINDVMQEIEKGNNDRMKIIMERVLTVALINKMMRDISVSDDNALLVEYESLLLNPEEEFKKLFRFFRFEWDQSVDEYLKSLDRDARPHHLTNPHNVMRNLDKQRNKTLGFISKEESRIARKYLIRCGLA